MASKMVKLLLIRSSESSASLRGGRTICSDPNVMVSSLELNKRKESEMIGFLLYSATKDVLDLEETKCPTGVAKSTGLCEGSWTILQEE